jgi:acyl-CoA synthetase (NDP forming)
MKTNNTVLTEVESRNLLKEWGVPQNSYGFASTKEEALQMAEKMQTDLVMKVVSPKIVHKSDFGGVKLGLKNLDDVSNAYDEILQSAFSHHISAEDIEGVILQEMVEAVQEVLVGVKRDPVFGVTLVIGLGGIWVELMKDVSLGISPLEESDIYQMLKKLKGYPLLSGYRGQHQADIGALVTLIKRVETMALQNPQIVEMDLNPVMVKREGEGCLAVDARIVIDH